MKLTILGCGTSTGVPIVGCDCAVCASERSENKRLRTSAHLRFEDGMEILIDTGPDLRQQALRYGVRVLEAVLITHLHADHIAGIDEIRVHNYLKKGPIDLFALPEHIAEIKKRFDYIFKPAIQRGGGKPNIVSHEVSGAFEVGGVEVIPVSLWHGKLACLGWRIGGLGYLTDVSHIPEASYDLVRDLDLLVIGALRWTPHSTHFSVDQALAEVEKIAPKRAILIHMGHDLDYDELCATLPEKVRPAFDGMTVELDEPPRKR